MLIIFGTRGIKHSVKDSPILHDSCPNCNRDLQNKLYRRWFTLFFIPVIPLDVIDRFYECNNCGNAYNESVKHVLQQSNEEQDRIQEEARRLFAQTLITTMTHMAIVDEVFAKEEEKEIDEAILNFPEYETELKTIVEKIRHEGNKDNQVFDLLNQARTELSSEALLNILAQAGLVLLADGLIEKEEEDLMKEYLIACGLPKDMYKNIIDKLKSNTESTSN